MDNFVYCFDAVEMVIDDANESRELLGYKLNGEKLDELEELCDIIDSLMDDCEGSGIEAEVDKSDMTVHIRIECVDLEISDKHPEFIEPFKKSKSCGFFLTEDELLGVEFVFPGVWDKVNAGESK